METFKEKIARHDAMFTMHYYVYKSYRGWRVDVIRFHDVSEIKNNYYKDKIFYDTFEGANAERDKLNIEWERNKVAEALNNME